MLLIVLAFIGGLSLFIAFLLFVVLPNFEPKGRIDLSQVLTGSFFTALGTALVWANASMVVKILLGMMCAGALAEIIVTKMYAGKTKDFHLLKSGLKKDYVNGSNGTFVVSAFLIAGLGFAGLFLKSVMSWLWALFS